MDPEWCDIRGSARDSSDHDPAVSICAISGSLKFGEFCEEESKARGEWVEGYALFDPLTKISDLPPHSGKRR
jgi:hypothetical protein